MKNILLSFAITFLTSLPALSANTKTVNVDGIYYCLDIDTKQAEVVSQNFEKYTGSIIIPATVTHDGEIYDVTVIGKGAFLQCNELVSVTIPSSVTSIKDYAFSLCRDLVSIQIPNSVTEILIDAFWCCSSLTSVTIPSSVTYIGDRVFAGCRSLTEIKVESDNPNYDSRNDCNAIIRTADNTLIAGCQTTVIPTDVTTISNYAFYQQSMLTSITIPSSVTTIDNAAFEYCPLTYILIPKSVTSLGDNVFWGDTQLLTVLMEAATPIPFPTDFNWDTLIEQSTLYVPFGAKQAYEQAEGWKNFMEIIEMDEEQMASVAAITHNTTSGSAVYDLLGRKLKAQPLKGLYITGGRKVLVK